MDKKAEFKKFASAHPELNKAVNKKQVTWQELYQTYDIYGADSNVWDEYLKNDGVDINRIKDSLKNIDYDKLQESITNAKKALGVIGTLIGMKTTDVANNINNPVNASKASNINSVFED